MLVALAIATGPDRSSGGRRSSTRRVLLALRRRRVDRPVPDHLRASGDAAATGCRRRLVGCVARRLLAAGLARVGLPAAGAAERRRRPATPPVDVRTGPASSTSSAARAATAPSGAAPTQGPDLRRRRRGRRRLLPDDRAHAAHRARPAAVTQAARLHADEIDALVAYVASLGDGPPIPDVDNPPRRPRGRRRAVPRQLRRVPQRGRHRRRARATGATRRRSRRHAGPGRRGHAHRSRADAGVRPDTFTPSR